MLNFSSLLQKKKKHIRIKRKKLVHTTKTPDGVLIVTRLIPWLKIKNGYVWMASLATSKSRKQINDWLDRKHRKKSVQKLNNHLTGLGGNLASAVALRQLYVWLDKLPEQDIIMFYCESAEAEKQMRIWCKWINRHHSSIIYSIDENTKSFYIYKPRDIE